MLYLGIFIGAILAGLSLLKSIGLKTIRWFFDFLKRNKTHVPGKFNDGQKANLFVSLLLIAGLFLFGFCGLDEIDVQPWFCGI